MAKFEHKENTGSVFTNDKKGNEKAPDLKGQVNVGGKLYDVAMWVKEGNKGKYYSMKVDEPRQRPEPGIGKNEIENLPF